MVESTSTVELELVCQIIVRLEITSSFCSIRLVNKLVKVRNVGSVVLVVMQIKLMLAHDGFKGVYCVGKWTLYHVRCAIFCFNRGNI